MEFPYGKAPLYILLLGLATGGYLLSARATQPPRPDLILVTFAKDHMPGHQEAADAFFAKTGKRVAIQLVEQRALYNRLAAAMQSGAEQPDLVELLEGSLGQFTKGPLADVGFVDLTDKVNAEGWRQKLVESRFSLWSSRGRIFAMPHDVHPMLLAYRRDLVEQLGIDVKKLTTWDEFCRVGREITKDTNGDGAMDRYMLDLPSDGADALRIVMLQRGVRVLNEAGEVAYDTPVAAELVEWYVRQCAGKDRIAFPAGWGQPLAQAVKDGLVLFYFCPDWRSRQFQNDIAAVNGKMALMPLPAWEEGGLRTSTWGATGLAITKACKDPELAWEFSKFVYYNKEFIPKQYKNNNILPPLKEAWSMPELNESDPYWGGQKRGQMYAEIAPQTPAKYLTAYQRVAEGKLNEAYVNSLTYFNSNGEKGFKEYIRAELKRTADQVRQQVDRNVFQGDAKKATAEVRP